MVQCGYGRGVLRSAPLVVVLALALIAPAADANNMVSNESVDFFANEVQYLQSGVVNNNVTVGSLGSDILFTEAAGGEIVESGTCSNPENDNTATCPTSGVTRIGVYVDEGNDAVHGNPAGLPIWVRAGAGNDDIELSTHADVAQLGSGDDTVHGGQGDDALSDDEYTVFTFSPGHRGRRFFGDQGDDSFLQTSTVSADTVTGGPNNAGGDTVDYSGRSAPVTVTPEAGGGDGEAGENDVVTGVENAIGGAAADVLTGGALANTLRGSDGNDVLTGGAGQDVLDGGTATRTTGTGDDVLRRRPRQGHLPAA